MIELIEQHRPEIDRLCQQYGVKRLDLFGSAAGDKFDPGRSDVDFFYEFDTEDQIGLADRFFGLKKDLEKLLGANVDLVSAADATNPYFLQVANQNRTTLYAA
jgi:hypothetical protein